MLAELATEWAAAVTAWRELATAHRAAELGRPDRNSCSGRRSSAPGPRARSRRTACSAYLHKAMREAKVHTTWTAPDEAYEAAVRASPTGVLADAEVWPPSARSSSSRRRRRRGWRLLGQKLVQLDHAGRPGRLPGHRAVDLSLVDPDNRRPVDFADRGAAA